MGEVTDGAALNGNDVKDGTALNGNTYDPHIYTDAAAPSDFSAAEERKLLAKIDFRLMPVLSILYLLAFLGSSLTSSHSATFHDLGLTSVYMRQIARMSQRSISPLSASLTWTSNIGNAAVYGLATDLGVAQGSNDYNTALTLFCMNFRV